MDPSPRDDIVPAHIVQNIARSNIELKLKKAAAEKIPYQEILAEHCQEGVDRTRAVVEAITNCPEIPTPQYYYDGDSVIADWKDATPRIFLFIGLFEEDDCSIKVMSLPPKMYCYKTIDNLINALSDMLQ